MKDRVYVCHTYYHAYISVLKELNLAKEERGKATLILSRMSNDFGNLKSRARESGLFEAVYEFDEKEDINFPELMKYHEDKGNIFLNMIYRIKYTKLLGKLQEPYVPVNFKEYKQIYIFCDSDPIGYFLSYKKIPYHAVEDGLDCISTYDTARYDNRGHFKLKSFLASLNLIFIQNGYAKYCIDMEVNNIACLPYPIKKYIERPRNELVNGVKKEDKKLLVSIFMDNIDNLEEQMQKQDKGKDSIMVLTEPLCDLETRKRLFHDIVNEFGKGCTVYIKPHPRDVLDYRKEFPDSIVIEGKFPMEIMNDIPNLRVKRLISVFTVVDSIHFADEIIYLGEDFMDKYEDPMLHRQNEMI